MIDVAKFSLVRQKSKSKKRPWILDFAKWERTDFFENQHSIYLGYIYFFNNSLVLQEITRLFQPTHHLRISPR